MTYLPRPLQDIVNSKIVGYDLNIYNIDCIRFVYRDTVKTWFARRSNGKYTDFVSGNTRYTSDSVAKIISDAGLKDKIKEAILRIDIIIEQYDIYDDELQRYADMDVPTMSDTRNDNIKTFTYRISYNNDSMSVYYVESGKLQTCLTYEEFARRMENIKRVEEQLKLAKQQELLTRKSKTAEIEHSDILNTVYNFTGKSIYIQKNIQKIEELHRIEFKRAIACFNKIRLGCYLESKSSVKILSWVCMSNRVLGRLEKQKVLARLGIRDVSLDKVDTVFRNYQYNLEYKQCIAEFNKIRVGCFNEFKSYNKILSWVI